MGEINKNHFDNPVVAFLTIALLVLGGYMLFSNKSETSTSLGNKKDDTILTTAYINTEANIRTCASMSCESVGTYIPNTSVDISLNNVSDVSQLPKWVSISYSNSDGSISTGYINKIVLSNTQIAASDVTRLTNQAVPSTKTVLSLPALIKKWSPNIALIMCTFSNGDSDFGSGFLTAYNGSINVLTNKHVITEDILGNLPVSCSIKIPGNGDKTYLLEGHDKIVSSDDFDWAYLIVVNGDTYLNSVAKNGENLLLCEEQEQVGDSVVVLGYPDYAGQFTSPTATRGIISGYASPYYTTDAPIESGNSGGVAIDIQKDCYVGIPSAVKTGNYANLGRILNANIPFKLPY